MDAAARRPVKPVVRRWFFRALVSAAFIGERKKGFSRALAKGVERRRSFGWQSGRRRRNFALVHP
jgi:hypothetical protein